MLFDHSLISNYNQVLLDGLHDPDSALNMLRMPAVKNPLIKKIWDLVTEDWQVIF